MALLSYNMLISSTPYIPSSDVPIVNKKESREARLDSILPELTDACLDQLELFSVIFGVVDSF